MMTLTLISFQYHQQHGIRAAHGRPWPHFCPVSTLSFTYLTVLIPKQRHRRVTGDTTRKYDGATENAGVEKAIRSKLQG